MKLLRFAALLLAVLAWARPARAQERDSAALHRAVSTVCPGARVRLAVAPADTVSGHCGWPEDGRLPVRWGGEERRVPLGDVEALWVRERGTASGARAGAIIGGLAAAGFGMYLANGLCDDTAGCGSDTLSVGVLLGFIGAFAGAATGGMIGGTTTGWDRRYP